MSVWYPAARVFPWGKKIRAYVAWHESIGRMTVRAFVAFWARERLVRG